MSDKSQNKMDPSVFEFTGLDAETSRVLASFVDSNNNVAKSIEVLANEIKNSNNVFLSNLTALSQNNKEVLDYFYGAKGEQSVFEKRLEKANNQLILKLSFLVGFITTIAGFIFWTIDNAAIADVIILIKKLHNIE